MWLRYLELAAGFVGLAGLVFCGFMLGRKWRLRYADAKAEGARLRSAATGGTAGATASAVSTGNVVNIVNGRTDDDRSPRALGGSDLWVPSTLLRRPPDRLDVGTTVTGDEYERSPVRERMERVRAAIARGDNTDDLWLDDRSGLSGPGSDESDSE